MHRENRNIKLFNLFAADILGSIYKEFPIPSCLSVDETMKRTITSVEKVFHEKVERSSFWFVDDPEREDCFLLDINQFWCETVIWLRYAGYLKFEDENLRIGRVGRAVGLSLTPKGLEVLNARIDALDPKRSVGDVLSDIAVSAGQEATISLAKDAVQTALGVGVKLVF